MSASGMFAFLSSGFSSRSSLTGARVFAFDRHAHVCTPAREKERILEGASIKKYFMLCTLKGDLVLFLISP